MDPGRYFRQIAAWHGGHPVLVSIRPAYHPDPQAVESLKKELRKDFLKNLEAVVSLVQKQMGRSLNAREVRNLADKASIDLMGAPTVTVHLANGQAVNADILQYSAPID